MDENLGHTLRVGDLIIIQTNNSYSVDHKFNGHSGILVKISSPYKVCWMYPIPEELDNPDDYFFISTVPTYLLKELNLPKDSLMICVSIININVIGSLNPEFYKDEETST